MSDHERHPFALRLLPPPTALDALVGGASRQIGDLHAEPASALAARTLHLRRQLAAAVDHGTDLLASLGLPRLVGPGFASIDVRAAGDALEAAVAALDALDGDPDAEPWLGWTSTAAGVVFMGDGSDREAEDLDELTLGWSGVSQLRLTACDDGFDPLDYGEAVNEDGDTLDERGEHDTADDEPCLGAPIGDGDQRHWSQGDARDVEDVNPGSGRPYSAAWREREPAHVPRLGAALRDMARRAQALKRGDCPPSAARPWSPPSLCNVTLPDGSPFVWAGNEGGARA